MALKVTIFGMLMALAVAPGCVPSHVIGPLRHEREERERLVVRSRASGVSLDLLNTVVPPLTPEEEGVMDEQTDSCRTSYLWKNGLTWTGGGFVAVAAGSTIVGAVATGNSDTSSKIVFGVSAGTLAALGSILQVIAGIIQVNFSDRGCVVK
ncbi:MAG: hypothetical protein M3O46_16320 [Myxococcota bacterium]|nr:hypothetical protein [Myxococcota bacterium]